MFKHKQPEFHYLLTSLFTWQSGDDLHDLMKQMDKRKEGIYWVWYVPGPTDSEYEINFYQPQVEGAFVLAEVNPKTKSKKGESK
jgi:hypothetical protein